MNTQHDERLDETADLPPKPTLRRDNNKRRLPPPSDKLVFGPVVQLDATPVLSEPLLNSVPAD